MEFSSVQFNSVTQSCLTLCDPMNRSTPGLPIHHQLPEFTQTHVHRVGDAIQPSYPLLSPSPHALKSFPASGSFQMSQLFTSSGQSIRVSASTSVLPMNTQDWSPLGWTGWTSLQSKGLSRVFSNTTVQKHQFFGAQLSLQSSSYIHTYYILSNVRGQLLRPLWIFSFSSKTHTPPRNFFFFTGSFPPDINIFIKQKQSTPKQQQQQPNSF